MIHQELKKLLEHLSNEDWPIVIDCGHIDTPNLIPRPADGFTLKEGFECFRALKEKGETQMSILFNDARLIQQSDSITEGRKKIRQLRSEIKSEGIHTLLLNTYHQIFKEYGVLNQKDFFKKDFVYLSENSLILQARQEIEKYRDGKSPFKKKLFPKEKGMGFQLKNKEKITLSYPDNGAPAWPLVSAKINKFYEEKGFKTIIYLRDIHWAPRVKTGEMVAKELYGCSIKTYAFFYKSTTSRRILPETRVIIS